jgi:hypothetical protein
MVTLDKRFMELKLKFLHKILNNSINCLELLQYINLKIIPI